MDKSKLITCDVECYPNYFLVMFRKFTSGELLYFEKFNDSNLNIRNILHVLNKYTIVTFNGIGYDQVVMEAACAGYSNAQIYKVSCMIIEDKMQPWQVRKQCGLARLDIDHIDLKEVAPLKAPLKIYAGRLHLEELEDLPIEPGTIITEEDIPGMRKYCGKDLKNTEGLFLTLEKEIELRCSMSDEYGVDLRSKSDAQIAEAVIKSEMQRDYDFTPKRPKVPEGTEYYYKPPANIQFETDILKDVLRQYTTRPFVVGKSGHVGFEFEITEEDRNKKGDLPTSKSKLKFEFGSSKYTVGTGGLHSNEKKTRHTNEGCFLRDYDVASFYPHIILNNKLAPEHLGTPFLDVYHSIVKRRLKAKREGNKVVNESLKITINGSFGKFGSKWSFLYAPDLMMQVTITGQLSLLMLIERMELAGIPVVSANTDGIVCKVPPEKDLEAANIIADWEFDTDYEMESTDYISLNSRDVNNYIAVKEGSIKGKGAYADQSDHYYRLRSNPNNEICSIAVKEFLSNGTPVEDTIRNHTRINEFVTLRTVNGGAVKDGQLLGKAIRWYYGSEEIDAIYYDTNGNKVPKSDGGVPIMDYPKQLPEDIDFDYYIEVAKGILKDIGFK